MWLACFLENKKKDHRIPLASLCEEKEVQGEANQPGSQKPFPTWASVMTSHSTVSFSSLVATQD